MKKLIIFALLLINTVITFPQLTETIDNVQYKKIRIFSDDFVDNRFEWIYDNSGLNKIEYGSLFYSNPFEFPYYDGKPIMLDINKNFAFESRIKFISGQVDKFNGIFWGDLIFGEKMFFGFSAMGEFIILESKGFDQQIIVKQKCDSIQRTDFNDLSVVKISDKYLFFINGKQVYQMQFQPFTGRYFGFSIAPKSYIQISYMKLWYLQQ